MKSFSTPRVAMLLNFIPPYRIPVLEALAKKVGELRIFISTPMEPNRSWPVEWGRLNVAVQRTLTYQRTWKHPYGFNEPNYIHLPYDTLSLLNRFGPDVIISGQFGFSTLQSGLYRRYKRNSRVIVWATLSEHNEAGRGRLRETLRKMLLPLTDAVLVNGESGARYIGSFGYPNKKIIRVNQTVDTALFSVLPLHKAQHSSHRLLYVGQLVERKGLLPFIVQTKTWCEQHPDRVVDFWLAGNGTLKDTLQRITRPDNLCLTFLDEIPYVEIPNIYAQGGILVLPTLADEWGLVVNEGMAAGLPILGSLYSQAVEELVTEGKTGWLFRPDHPDEIYRALDRCLSTPLDGLGVMRESCRQRIQKLTPQTTAGRIYDAIQFVIEN